MLLANFISVSGRHFKMKKKLLLLLIFILSTILALSITLKSDTFKHYALQKVQKIVEESTDGKIKIEEIDFNFPFQIALKEISTPLIHVDEALLNLSLKKLLYGEIDIKELILSDVSFVDSFETKKTSLSEIQKLPDVSLPSFIRSLNVEHIEIQNLKIDHHLLNIKGSVIFENELQELNLNLLTYDSLISKSPIRTIISLKQDITNWILNLSLEHKTDHLRSVIHIDENFNLTLNHLSGNYANYLNLRSRELKISLFPLKIEGHIAGLLRNISFKDLKSKGTLSFHSLFSMDETKVQNVTTTFKSKRLNTESACLRSISGLVSIKNLFENPLCDVNLKINQISLKNNEQPLIFKEIDFTTHLDLKNQSSSFILACKEDKALHFEIQTEGETSFDQNILKISLKDAKGTLQNESFSLIDPFKIRIKNKQLKTTTLHLKYGDYILKTTPSFKDTQITLQGSLKTGSLKPLEFNANLPIQLSIKPLTLNIDEDAPIFARLTTDGEIDQFIQHHFGYGVHLFGDANIQIDIVGSLKEPHITGIAEVTNGSFEIPETGMLYKKIEASLELYDKIVTLKDLKATDAFEGKIKGSGSLELDSINHYPFSFDIEIEDTKLLRLDYATASGNAKLKLIGDFEKASLIGKVKASDAKVEIPKKSKTAIYSLDVTYLDETGNTIKHFYEPEIETWPLNLDLDFDIDKPFTITGEDLKSNWKGSLRVKGTASHPELFGQFKLINGQYKFRGKLIEIHEGIIAFSGDPGKKTSLYVIGNQEIGDIRADIILKGPLRSPALSFRSNPPLPQKEIISRILFGHGADDLTAYEGIELNQSIKDLSQGSGGKDILTKIRDKFHVDTIDITRNSQSENNEVSVKVGKYLSQGILVSVNKSVNAEVNRLAIEAKIFKDLKIQAEVGDDSKGQLNLKWKKDY